MKNKLINIFTNNQHTLDKKHKKYLENVDFHDGVVKQQIEEHRIIIEAELSATDYIDEQQLNAALSVYDEYMKNVIENINLKKTQPAKTIRNLEKAIRIFDTHVMKEIHRFGLFIYESKMSATFGRAMDDGHVITSEWIDTIESILSEDANKLNNPTTNMLRKIIIVFLLIMSLPFILSSALPSPKKEYDEEQVKIKVKPIKYTHYIEKYISKVLENYAEEIHYSRSQENDVEDFVMEPEIETRATYSSMDEEIPNSYNSFDPISLGWYSCTLANR